MTHVCHHPKCRAPVPPKMLACRPHWFMLPQELRNAVWRAYQPGQEITKRPSAEYVGVIRRVTEYWLSREK